MIIGFDGLPRFREHVLCDGCFDPLHYGHLHYLEAARTKGRVVVSVASDDQIRAKGKIPFLPQDQRVALLNGLSIVDAVYLKDRPTEDVLEQMRPRCYVKGWDWLGKLPLEQKDVLARYGIPVWFPVTHTDSSTKRLRAWALADAERSLDRLEGVIAEQAMTPPERFDTEYFAGDWRADGNAYTFDTRRAIEGQQPQILKELWGHLSILDVGCGPGYLVKLLRELDVDAGGCDPSPDAVTMADSPRVIRAFPFEMPDQIADVVICREVLEHLTVTHLARTVYDLFRMARKFVYLTTRFSAEGVFDCATDFETDPTHITLLSQPYVRSLCVLNGGKRRRDLEQRLDWMGKGRVLVYEK